MTAEPLAFQQSPRGVGHSWGTVRHERRRGGDAECSEQASGDGARDPERWPIEAEGWER